MMGEDMLYDEPLRLDVDLSASFPGRLTSFQQFTAAASGTYTTPLGTRAIWVRAIGGAGGGGGAAQASTQAAVGGGGASGGLCEKLIFAPLATYAYTVGAGGAGGIAGNNAGTNGADTTFGTALMVASKGNGGSGGAASATNAVILGGASAISTGGDINAAGMPGGFGVHFATAAGASGAGGGSFFVGGGNSVNTEAPGNPGLGPGCGGSGGTCLGTTARAGGNGIDGSIMVFEYR